MKSLILIGFIFTGFFYDQPPKKQAIPTLKAAVGVQDPVFDETNDTYNFVIYGNYTKISDKVWIKMYVRESKKNDEKNVQTNLYGPVKLKAASKPGEAYSIIRDSDEPRSGSFLSLVQCPTSKYRPNTHQYEYKVEFYEGEKLLGVHREKDKEWIPVPIK